MPLSFNVGYADVPLQVAILSKNAQEISINCFQEEVYHDVGHSAI